MIDIKRFTTKGRATLPILKCMWSKDGYLHATNNLEVSVKVPTAISEGVYLSINPLVKADIDIKEALQFPEKKDVVSTFSYNKETISEMQKHIKNIVKDKYILEKNFSPIMTGFWIGDGKIVGTDSFSLYEAKIDGLNHEQYILPYQAKEIIMAIDTDRWTGDDSAIVYITKNNSIHIWANGIRYWACLIKGNTVDYSGIIPKGELEKIDTTSLLDRIVVAKVKGENKVSIGDSFISIKNAPLLLKDVWENNRTTIINRNGNVLKLMRFILY